MIRRLILPWSTIVKGDEKLRALFVTAGGFEDMEFFCPYYRLQEAGLEIDVASAETGLLKGIRGYQVEANLSFNRVDPSLYDLLVFPGGRAPQTVRRDEKALQLVRDYWARNKPVAAICHGPQILISAGLVAGRRMTAYHKVQPELAEARAIVQDVPVVVDGMLITSRQPQDLPFFNREVIRVLFPE